MWHSRIELKIVTGVDVQAVLECIDDAGKYIEGSLADSNLLFPFIGENGQPRPLRSVLQSVRTRWGAIVLLEEPYMDLEYWDGHSQLYGKCFTRFPVACARLHFFSSRDLRSDPKSYDLGFAERIVDAIRKARSWMEIRRELQSQEPLYHGYSVVRPTGSYLVSRTSIDFDTRLRRDLADPNEDALPDMLDESLVGEELSNGRPRLCVRHIRDVHILATSITVTNPEFLQQDPNCITRDANSVQLCNGQEEDLGCAATDVLCRYDMGGALCWAGSVVEVVRRGPEEVNAT